MNTNLKQLKNILESKGVRPTYQRISILKYIIENKTHPTAEMIYEHLVKDIPTISKTTVYNTINMFIEKGVARQLLTTGTEIRLDNSIIPHHHFLCEHCGKVIDLDIKYLDCTKVKIDGHIIKELFGYFRGICKDCIKKGRK